MAPSIDGLVKKESNVIVFSVCRVLQNQSSSLSGKHGDSHPTWTCDNAPISYFLKKHATMYM